ncbi:hypothetical protein ACP275_14G257700 [Erythranthe tilingii]
MMSDDSSVHPSIRAFLQDPIPNPTDPNPNPNSNPSKRKRNLPGTPDPDAEVIALSPKSLTATNRFFCEICNKGFKRDQNLQLHRRGHNLPWKLKQRSNKEVIRKKVYICPEKTCVHHETSRALGDLTGIKKHYSRKHGEKKWKCEKCSKKYAVQSDWKAHSKICGTREYKCDCGTLFSRKDSFITHRAFCDALAEESTRFSTAPPMASSSNLNFRNSHDLMNNSLQINGGGGGGGPHFSGMFRPPEMMGLESGMNNNNNNNHLDNINLQKPRLPMWLDNNNNNNNNNTNYLVEQMGGGTSSPAQNNQWYNFSRSSGQESSFAGGDVINNNNNNNGSRLSSVMKEEEENNKGSSLSEAISSMYNNYGSNTNNQQNNQTNNSPAVPMSATALLQKAAQMGSTRSNNSAAAAFGAGFGLMSSAFSNLGSFNNSLNQSRINEEAAARSHHHHHLHQNNNTLDGLMAAASASNNGGGGDMINNSDGSAPMWKRSQLINIDAENSMTRDFLGVGGNDESRRFLQENYNSGGGGGGGEGCFNGFRSGGDEPL